VDVSLLTARLFTEVRVILQEWVSERVDNKHTLKLDARSGKL
jgi:hypothetical protein